jgi:hypothetical protein
MLLAGLLGLLATTASAQSTASQPAEARPSATAPAPAPAALSAPPLPTAADPCAQTESDYTEAFDDLVQGEDEKALAALERVLAVCPHHPYAGELARLARARLGPGAQLAEASLLTVEKPSGFARGSLVVWQTLHGATQGALLCAIADCEARAALGVSLLGAGAGAAVSWLLSDGGVTSGQSGAINSGTTWGIWYGLATIGMLDLDGDTSAGAVMASMAGFTGMGVAVALLLVPTAGQVSLANSGGLWTGVVTALILATMDNGDTKSFFAIESLVSTVGILSFAALAQNYPVSQGRVLLIDSGGVLGGLLGAATVALLGGDGDGAAIGAGVGALAGLGFTTWLTRNFDTPASAGPQVSMGPSLLGQQGMGLMVGGRF